MRFHLAPVFMTIIKKTSIKHYENVNKRNPLYPAGWDTN